jgi:hypothetical protein
VRQTLHGLHGAVDERQLTAVDLVQPADHFRIDLLRRLRQPDHVVHIARPLERAHAHHVPRGALVPAAAALGRELHAGLVPDVLGVDDDSVEVEDHGVDAVHYRETYRRST